MEKTTIIVDDELDLRPKFVRLQATHKNHPL